MSARGENEQQVGKGRAQHVSRGSRPRSQAPVPPQASLRPSPRSCSSSTRLFIDGSSLAFSLSSTLALFCACFDSSAHSLLTRSACLIPVARSAPASAFVFPPAARTKEDEVAAPVLARPRRLLRCNRAHASCDRGSVQAAAQVGTRPVRVSRSHGSTRSGLLSRPVTGERLALVNSSAKCD
jgi:hypothetical protein